MAEFEFNDVANYQPDTLAYFQGLKAKGSGAAIVKITEYVNYINPKATNQVINADKAELRTAGYHFARFGGDIAQAHQEASFFIAQASARLAKGSILALDYEANASNNKANNTNAIIAFMQDVKNAGFIPWFYSGKYYITPNVDHAKVNKTFPNATWLASYPGTSYPDFDYFPSLDGVIAWQYTNNWKSLGVDGSTLLLDWPEGNKKTVAKAKTKTKADGKGVTVWSKGGIWYTDKAFKNKANGIIKHMGAYWSFKDGKLIKDAWTKQWGHYYWSGKDGKLVQGTGTWHHVKWDFGNDGTFYVRGASAENVDQLIEELNK